MKNFSKTQILVGVLALVIVGGAGFFGGLKYQQHKTQSAKGSLTRGQFFSTGGMGTGTRARGAGSFGGFVTGKIISMDDKSITVQAMAPNGANATGANANSSNTGSRIIYYSASSQISKSSTGAPSDLSVGKSVTITGSSNSDGSITAQSIQIR